MTNSFVVRLLGFVAGVIAAVAAVVAGIVSSIGGILPPPPTEPPCQVGDDDDQQAGNDQGHDAGVTDPGCDGHDAGPPSPVQVQILAINDFHGNLTPPQGSSGAVLAPAGDPGAGDAGVVNVGNGNELVQAGGAAYLATHINALRATNPNTIVVSAGDLSGASPLVSALFHDEPSILVMNEIGIDYNAVGNHEFDHGSAELLRLQYGGCNATSGCFTDAGFPGANFEYLAANVEEGPNHTIFPRYGIKHVNGVKIAFIGMTLEGTPGIVPPSGVQGLTFDDEITTVNALVPELQKQDVAAIVLLIHQGGFVTGTYNECPGLSGDILPIVNGLDPAVQVVVSAHTHQAYNCTINGRLLTSAASFGRLITKIDLTIDPVKKQLLTKTANNVIVTPDVPPSANVQAIINEYAAIAAPLANKVVGHATQTIKSAQGFNGESPLGQIVADSQLAATSAADVGGAQIAFMNPGGIRADLVPNANGEITYAASFAIQPFGSNLITMTLTGDQIHTILAAQFTTNPPKVLAVSDGFTYTFKVTPFGVTVDPSTMKLNGTVIDPAASYRVVANSFLATGGDSFAVFNTGTNRLGGVIDVDAFNAYLATHDPITASTTSRITRQ